jgi:hypothetical protein
VTRTIVRATITLVTCLSLSGSATAYELRTHASITAESAARSRHVERYLADVGLALDTVFDRAAVARPDQLAEVVNDATAFGWLVEGAIREDDYRSHPLLEQLFGCTPPLNPPSAIDRPIHHFFDAQRDGAGLGLAGGFPAPDWALGLQGRGTTADTNQFSLPDARAYQLRSLTEPRREDRDRYTARMFRALGHAVHLLQDMAQPQHTRNDPHLACDSAVLRFIAGETSWYEAYIETRALGVSYRGRADASRPLALAGYDAVDLPTYRQYWTNPDGSGLAEFSSRNFFTAGTNLGGRCGGLARPACDPRAYRSDDVDFAIPTVSGETVTGRVRFLLGDVIDPLTGERLSDVRLSTRSLWDQHLEAAQQAPKFSLNTFNYDAMADVLVPRAVGYSAGLLDYFFRGRLDVDLIADPADPAVVRVSGTNDSPDPLIDGTLTLYVEDATGARAPAPPLDATDVAGVVPGGDVLSARFQLPPTGDRFVAVYQGTLGAEPRDATTARPGGVIGKALGGTLVEQVFSDGVTWRLRTVDGVFALPISVAEIRQLVWGDDGSSLVGRTALGVGAANMFATYAVPRDPITGKVVAQPDGSVAVAPLARVPFPDGMDLGTEVQLTHTIRYREYLPQFLHTIALNLDGAIESETFSVDPNLVETRQTLNRTFRPTLDLARLDNSRATPYRWSLNQFGLSVDGRILAVVSVTLGLRGEQATFPTRQYVLPCPAFPCPTQAGSRSISFAFPVDRSGAAVVALVDVGSGRVVASTAPATLSMTHVGVHTVIGNCDSTTSGCTIAEARHWIIPRENRDFFDEFLGKPERGNWELAMSPTPPPTGSPDFGRLAHVFGTVTADVGQYRPELADAQFPPFPARRQQTLFACAAWDRAPRPGPCFTIDLDQFDVFFDRFTDALRARSAPERLALVSRQIQGFTDRIFVRLVAWDPDAGRATRRHQDESGDFVFLGSTSRRAAILTKFSDELAVVPLEGDAPVGKFSIAAEAARNFRALDPGFVYNADDLKFYRVRANLQRTALPRPLAAGGSAVGDFHAVTSP